MGIDGFIYNAMKNHQVIMVIMGFMVTMLTNIMQKNIFTNLMNMTKKIKAFISISLSIMLSSRSLSGMHMDVQKNRSTGNNEVFIEHRQNYPIIKVTADSIANLTAAFIELGTGTK